MQTRNSRRTVFLVILLLHATLFQMSTAAQQQRQVYSASETWEVSPGDYIQYEGIPARGQTEDLDIFQTAADIIGGYNKGGIYGGLNAVLPQVIRSARLGGTVGDIIDQLFGIERYANCAPVSVVIPFGVRIVGIKYQASDEFGRGDCKIGSDCQVGWSRFDAPLYFYSGGSQIIVSNFRNWSGDRTRTATMTVYFTVGSPFENQRLLVVMSRADEVPSGRVEVSQDPLSNGFVSSEEKRAAARLIGMNHDTSKPSTYGLIGGELVVVDYGWIAPPPESTTKAL